MSMNAIKFDRESGMFEFDGTIVSRRQLNRLVREARSKPVYHRTHFSASGQRRRLPIPNLVEVGYISVTPNYIEQMFAFVDRHGWFLDHTDVTGDHCFDPNVPTPGSHWGYAARLKEMARRYDALADDACDLGLLHCQEANWDIADALYREASRLRKREGARPRDLEV